MKRSGGYLAILVCALVSTNCALKERPSTEARRVALVQEKVTALSKAIVDLDVRAFRALLSPKQIQEELRTTDDAKIDEELFKTLQRQRSGWIRTLGGNEKVRTHRLRVDKIVEGNGGALKVYVSFDGKREEKSLNFAEDHGVIVFTGLRQAGGSPAMPQWEPWPWRYENETYDWQAYWYSDSHHYPGECWHYVEKIPPTKT